MDFYDTLAARENEALRRARRISEAENAAAQSFREHNAAPPASATPHRQQTVDRAVPPLFGDLPLGNLLRGGLFSSPDFSLIATLFFLLNSESSDPLLMLALIYIMM